MANPKINIVNVGGVDFMLQAVSGSSDSSFADSTIEVALKKLIDSFSTDGTYTGRFKATSTPDKWFSYQIDIFDSVASGYIVNTVDPNESYNIKYETQTDAQAIIVKTLSSHIGMIIHSSTLDTEAKVIAVYGGTAWSKIEGRVLVGDGTVTIDNVDHTFTQGAIGGEVEHTLTIDELPSHKHTIPYTGYTLNTGGSGMTYGLVQNGGTRNSGVVGGDQAHNIMQPYKVVYIWERTA